METGRHSCKCRPVFKSLENSEAADKVACPIGGTLNIFGNLYAVQRIDHFSAAHVNSHMALKADHVASLQVVHAFNPLIFGAFLPSCRRHIALHNARLVKAPVHKSGAVKGIRTFRAAYITAAQLGLGYGDQLLNAACVRRSARRLARRFTCGSILFRASACLGRRRLCFCRHKSVQGLLAYFSILL